MERLIAAIRENPDYVDEVRGEFDAAVKALTPDNATPEQGRSIRKFAAVYIAGVLAVRFGVLPITPEEIRAAVANVRDRYLSYSPSVPDSHRGMIQLREFLVRNHASLPAVSDPKAKGGGVKGFRSGSGQYLFTEEQLGAASGVGTSGIQELAKNLKAKGFLATNEPGRMKSKFKLASAGGQFVRFYAVKGSLLEADLGGEEISIPPTDSPEEVAAVPVLAGDGNDAVVPPKKKFAFGRATSELISDVVSEMTPVSESSEDSPCNDVGGIEPKTGENEATQDRPKVVADVLPSATPQRTGLFARKPNPF